MVLLVSGKALQLNGLTNKSYNVIELQCAPMHPTIKLLVNGEAL